MEGFNKNSSFNFNYSVFSSAAKSTTFSPCTNHPVKCDLWQKYTISKIIQAFVCQMIK